uniref:Uncharacterized protein n=1 Tax=viral metagenome TaxID=1070528 RepID=A0A6C0H4V8_9ZZZZ
MVKYRDTAFVKIFTYLKLKLKTNNDNFNVGYYINGISYNIEMNEFYSIIKDLATLKDKSEPKPKNKNKIASGILIDNDVIHVGNALFSLFLMYTKIHKHFDIDYFISLVNVKRPDHYDNTSKEQCKYIKDMVLTLC